MEHSLEMNHLKMHTLEGDEWKMVFPMCYSHFKYIVMPFALTNALVVFQHLINDIFHEYLDDFVVCYIDDILIFLKNMEDHKNHACFVLEKLWEIILYAKLEKCEFHQISSGILRLYCLWRWHSHGFSQGSNHYWLDYLSFCLWCSMFFWIHQLLSTFHF